MNLNPNIIIMDKVAKHNFSSCLEVFWMYPKIQFMERENSFVYTHLSTVLFPFLSLRLSGQED